MLTEVFLFWIWLVEGNQEELRCLLCIFRVFSLECMEIVSVVVFRNTDIPGKVKGQVHQKIKFAWFLLTHMMLNTFRELPSSDHKWRFLGDIREIFRPPHRHNCYTSCHGLTRPHSGSIEIFLKRREWFMCEKQTKLTTLIDIYSKCFAHIHFRRTNRMQNKVLFFTHKALSSLQKNLIEPLWADGLI